MTKHAMIILAGLCLLLVMPLSGCDDDDSGNADTADPAEQYAVLNTVAPDFSSGAHAVINVEPPRQAQNNLQPAISDLGLSTAGRYFYRLMRKDSDSVVKYAVTAPAEPIWQFSARDDADTVSSTNPYALLTAAEDKGYLLRYGSTKAWIVDPSVTQEGQFKTGTLDLSAYADADGFPEMSTGVIVDERLFVVMQRLDRDNDYDPGQAYVAVFDITDNAEIDTGVAETEADELDNVKGFPLPVENPAKLQYLPEQEMIYVVGAGRYASSLSDTTVDYSGGIARIDTATYATELVVDDGQVLPDYEPMQITDLALVSPTQGYFIGYVGWQNTTLYRFDPSTGEVQSEAVAELYNRDLRTIAIDSQDKLWVGVAAADAPGITVIDTGDDRVETALIGLDGMNPASVGSGIAFCQVSDR